MADYYIQFSEALLIENEEQERWLKDLFAEGERLHEKAMDKDDPEAVKKMWEVFDRAWGIEGFEEGWSWPGFAYEFWADDARRYLWVYGDESGCIQNVGAIVQAFLKRFRPDGAFRLTWAHTCSKMRIGDFGGGGMLVTAKGIVWFDTDVMIDRYLKRYHKGRVRLNA